MAYKEPGKTLRDLQPGDVITVRHRGDDYRFQVSTVDVDTEKPDIYGQQYHVLAKGDATEYRLFSTEYTSESTVTIEYNVANNPNSPVWKCIGTIDEISRESRPGE